MSPILPDSELGRLIAIKKELENLLKLTLLIIQLCSSNTNNATIKLKVTLLIANIKRVKTLRTDYLQLAERDRQDINEELNSINTIISSGNTIKNVRVNSQTLNSLIHNLRNLSQQTRAAINQTANHILIIDTRDRIALASSRLPNRPSRFPSIPDDLSIRPYSHPIRPTGLVPSPDLPPPQVPPFPTPPRLQRRPNIGTRPTSLVRQQAIHLGDLDLDLDALQTTTLSRTSSSSSLDRGFGKKYLRSRKRMRRKRETKKLKSRKARK
jgi:hypothetical protein